MGLSHQLSQGSTLYDEILYVRPPASVILHSINFTYPLNYAPVLSSRYISIFQIGAYSAVASVLIGHWFRFGTPGVFLISVASFLLNFHNFPPMPWHTIDGIFFSVAAVGFSFIARNKSNILWIISAFLCAILAALSKQPFYITPLLVSCVLLFRISLQRVIYVILSGAFACVAMYIFLHYALNINLNKMLESISAQTSLRDLAKAGAINFLRDWMLPRAIFSAAPLAALLVYWEHLRRNNIELRVRNTVRIYSALAVFIYLAGMLINFSRENTWVYIGSLIDVIFTVTAAISVLEALRTRSSVWFGMAILHVIAWAASISWGYLTVALFSTPSIGVASVVLRDVFRVDAMRSYFMAILAILLLAAAFITGRQFIYSLEGPLRRSENTVNIGNDFPALRGIYTTETEASALRELSNLKQCLNGRGIVAPNWPLYSVIFGESSPLGINWLLNAETQPFEQRIRERLSKVNYVLIPKDYDLSNIDQKFGSKFTNLISETWQQSVLETKFFNVFFNPFYEMGKPENSACKY